MKQYVLTGAEHCTHVAKHPERTAYKRAGGLNFDITYQVWPNRASMLKTLEMQRKRERAFDDWTACKVAEVTL